MSSFSTSFAIQLHTSDHPIRLFILCVSIKFLHSSSPCDHSSSSSHQSTIESSHLSIPDTFSTCGSYKFDIHTADPSGAVINIMAGVATTVFVNHTQGPLKIQVGNPHYKADLATVEKDGKYTIEVDYNATYCEYFMGAVHAATDKKLVVSTDDCCDYRSITIKELGNGTFEVQKEPRSAPATAPSAMGSTRNLKSSTPSVHGNQSAFKFMGGYMKIIPKLGMNWRFWKQQTLVTA